MAGFTDLVAAAQPALAAVDGAATEGRSWRFEFAGLADATGADVDFSTGYTFDARVISAVDGTNVGQSDLDPVVLGAGIGVRF